MRRLRWMAGLLAGLLLWNVPAVTVAEPPPPAANPAERWQGFADDGHGWRIRFELELVSGADGKPTAFVSLPDMAGPRFPAGTTTVDGDHLQATIFPNWISFAGRFAADRSTFSGQLDNWGEKLAFVLHRDAPEFRCYAIPRCDARGEAVTTYTYRRPRQQRDGLRTARASEVDIDPKPLEELMRRTLAGDYPTANAVLVARHGKLVFEEYSYGAAAGQLRTLQSATKSVASLLVGASVDRKELADVTTPVYQILTGRQGHAWIDRRYPITLQQVLSMSSGLHWRNLTSDTPVTESDDYRMATSSDIVSYILDRDWDGPVDGRFHYNSGMSILLAAIAQDASGQDAEKLAQERLFTPLGIRRHKWMRHSSGIVHSGGGLFLTARDLLKIGQLVLDDGRWRGRQIISSAWIRESTRTQSSGGELDSRPRRWAERWGYPEAPWGYGYQWWLIPVPYQDRMLRTVTAWGNGEQWLIVVPELDLVVVMLSSDVSNSATRRFERLTKFILPAVR